ncbi:hypothetical protein [Pyrodictium delaneyi]|uniref:Uncharacterized protein n=1 Tax=Pyrodictium delaneyi TaxID=1273541 RepID=A0A211YRE4_9CREN|nr:hypothetical protein [Pyrodictium delaneyi]OWJ55625.1 hypothetical protein Pdsh_02225 [Pyrodictium delaneyi]
MTCTRAQVVALLEKIEKELAGLCRELEIDRERCESLLSPLRLRKNRLLEVEAERADYELMALA